MSVLGSYIESSAIYFLLMNVLKGLFANGVQLFSVGPLKVGQFFILSQSFCFPFNNFDNFDQCFGQRLVKSHFCQ